MGSARTLPRRSNASKRSASEPSTSSSKAASSNAKTTPSWRTVRANVVVFMPRCTDAKVGLLAEYGDIMSRFYISHETFLAIKTLPLKSGMRTLLETISNASELSSYRFRQGEKSVRSDLPAVCDLCLFLTALLRQLFLKLNKVCLSRRPLHASLLTFRLQGLKFPASKVVTTADRVSVHRISCFGSSASADSRTRRS